MNQPDLPSDVQLVVRGRVVARATGAPLPRARISLHLDQRAWRRVADLEGRYAIRWRGAKETPAREELERAELVVHDAHGEVAWRGPLQVGVPEQLVELDDAHVLATGIRAPLARPPLSGDFLAGLRGAIDYLPPEDHDSAVAILDRLTCWLPPLLVDPGILDLARDTLRGGVASTAALRDLLDRAELWGGDGRAAPPSVSNAQAATWLSALANATPHDHTHAPQGLIRMEDRVLLLGAALVAAGPNPVRQVRAVELVFGQLSVAQRLESLDAAARIAEAGEPIALRGWLGVFGGCGDFGSPMPGPGGFPWPRPGPFPWPEPPSGPIRECEGEAVRAFLEAMARTVRYTIDSIEPSDACPGDELIIRGTGLSFEGHTGVVLFASETPRVQIPAEPTSWTETEIRVVVPDGAVCGDLELDIPVAASIHVCGVDLDLHMGPSTPARFEGGRTTIRAFGHSGRGCLRVGDRVRFGWRLCNATEHELTLVRRTEGHVDVTRPPRASAHDFYDHILATSDLDYELEAILVARGPCGTDTASVRFGVQRRLNRTGDPFSPRAFRNWFGNVRAPVRAARPTTLTGLVEAVLAAERAGATLGIEGSGWSYTECVIAPSTPSMIDTSGLARALTAVIPGALRGSIEAVFPAALVPTLEAVTGPLPPVAERLVHVEAGIKVHALNCLLDRMSPALAMPTLGGSNGQSVAGAFSTGTHGANLDMPPIADFVRAIHLVGPGGQQWWLEPASRPITDPARMADLARAGRIDPCIRVEYDDDLFFSTLVSVGCAGVIYAVVLEAVPAHRLSSTTTALTWDAAKAAVRGDLAAPTAPWFAELIVNPTRTAVLTRRAPTGLPLPVATPPDGTLGDVLLVFLVGSGVAIGPGLVGLGSGAIGAVIGAVPFYLMRRFAELAPQPWRWGEIVEEVELLERLIELTRELTRVIASEGDEEAIARAIPALFNVMWQIGLYVVDGRTLVEQAQNLFTLVGQRRPGTTIAKSYGAMTGQGDCTAPGYAPPGPHSAFERLIHSSEYAVPADRTLDFADALLRAADRVRTTNDALILNLAIRFTAPTGALLGMQRAEPGSAGRVGHVEVFTVSGLAGNVAFHPEVDRIAREFGARPHWGQLHEVLADYGPLFPALPRWRRAMERIASTGGGDPGTFRGGFATVRGLLPPR